MAGEYKGRNKVTMARCVTCGHEWRVTPSRLLKGKGCPSCTRRRDANGLKTNEQFRRDAQEKNSCLDVVGEYRGVHTPIDVRCRKCGRVWKMTPNGILRGTGCAKCKDGRPKKTTRQFQEELAKANPGILPLDEYRGALVKILARCLACGNEWRAAPTHLLQGTGCPQCARKRMGAHNRKSHEQFVNEVAQMSPGVEVLGTYETKASRIECRCRACGHTWTTSAQSLAQGSGCPVCSARKGAEAQRGVKLRDRTRGVRCMETGRTYRSATSASHAMGLSDPSVGHAIRRGGTAAGLHWEYIE